MIEREKVLYRIEKNIAKYGYHVTLVNGAALPRFGYTIGCKEFFGSELIFAGGEFYSQSDVSKIFAQVVSELKKGLEWRQLSINVPSLGSFSLSSVDKSWSKLLALGAFDYYNQLEVSALQILPEKAYCTLDIPDMEEEFDAKMQPVWQWLVREWNYSIPPNSTVVTNLKVLQGGKATEVMRWKTNEWEIFAGAGPDVPKEEMRTLPLGVLLGIDKTLESATHLETGKGLWRDPIQLEWKHWE